MHDLTIDAEAIGTSGAMSVYLAAVDELDRRYGDEDESRMSPLELSSPSGVFVVARVNGALAGGVGVRPIGDPSQHLGEVKRLWVRPDLRRSGVATSLMNDVERRARDHGFHRLFLETGAKQPEAIALYRSSGWRQVDEFPPGAFTHAGALRFSKAL